MPRGLNKKFETNTLQRDLFSKIMSDLNETKRIECASPDKVIQAFAEAEAAKGKIFETGEILTPLLEDIFINVHSAFKIDHSYTSRTILYGPPIECDKKRKYRLPPALPNTVFRIVLVSGTHELFEWDILSKMMGSQCTFLPQGSAVKFTQGFSDYTYNNSSKYDREIYPGKGIKYPEKRHLIIFDFMSDDPEEIKKIQAKTLDKASASLTKTSGIISDLFKSIGVSKPEM